MLICIITVVRVTPKTFLSSSSLCCACGKDLMFWHVFDIEMAEKLWRLWHEGNRRRRCSELLAYHLLDRGFLRGQGKLYCIIAVTIEAC